jgi:4-hydroxybenzoyl-CoA thioesterase
VKSFETSQVVRFGHVDPAGIAYYPRIFDYIHEAFEDLWDKHVGKRYYEMIAQDRLGFPLVHSEVDFESPLHFGDRPRVRITCFQLGRSSIGLRYRYEVDGRSCLVARMTVVCVALDGLRSIPIPPEYRAKFEEILEPREDQ